MTLLSPGPDMDLEAIEFKRLKDLLQAQPCYNKSNTLNIEYKPPIFNYAYSYNVISAIELTLPWLRKLWPSEEIPFSWSLWLLMSVIRDWTWLLCLFRTLMSFPASRYNPSMVSWVRDSQCSMLAISLSNFFRYSSPEDRCSTLDSDWSKRRSYLMRRSDTLRCRLSRSSRLSLSLWACWNCMMLSTHCLTLPLCELMSSFND